MQSLQDHYKYNLFVSIILLNKILVCFIYAHSHLMYIKQNYILFDYFEGLIFIVLGIIDKYNVLF